MTFRQQTTNFRINYVRIQILRPEFDGCEAQLEPEKQRCRTRAHQHHHSSTSHQLCFFFRAVVFLSENRTIRWNNWRDLDQPTIHKSLRMSKKTIWNVSNAIAVYDDFGG